MAFINITPVDEAFVETNINSIELGVVQGNGIETTPDIDIKVTNLNGGKKHFTNNSGEGDKFKIKVLINQEETVTYYDDETEENYNYTTDMIYDYEEDEDYLLDEIGGSYIMRKDYSDNKIMNFIPSTLVYGIISIDEKDKPVIYKNQNYFDYLSDEDKLYYCDVIDKAVNQDIDYEEYLSLVCEHKKSPNEKNFVLTKKH